MMSISSLVKQTVKSVITSLPASDSLYRLCRLYVDRYNGDNNVDADKNGELTLLRAKLPQCRTVFDVGANVGNWAALALSVNPDIELHCFEPSRATFERLRGRSLPPRVTLNNFGMGAHKAEAELFVFADGSGMNSLHERQGLADYGIAPATQRETIHIESLDDYCEQANVQEIDFLKLDVEGHELEVLKGARRMLSGRRIQIVQFEYGGCNIDSRVLLKDIWSAFDGLGYTFFKLYPDRQRQYDGYLQSLERFQYQNWAVIRNDV